MKELNIKLTEAMNEYKLQYVLKTLSNKEILNCYRELIQSKNKIFNDELSLHITLPLTMEMVGRFVEQNEEKE